MAARFEYEVTSRDKSKPGIDSAKKNLGDLEKATQAFSGVMKAAIAGLSFAAVGAGIKKVVDLYAEQQRAEIRLSAATRNNPYINGEAAKRLTEYASALQKNSVYGDEQIIQQQALLVSMGLTENQIKAVMDASIDLASSGMMNLDAAVKNLSRTYSGMTGLLGETIPALRNLTQEQLKSGAAVEMVKRQFAGIGEAVAQGVGGQIQQLKNTLGDIGETIGGALAPIGNSLIQTLKPALDGIAQWFTDNQGAIINFFTNLPQIGAIAFRALRGVLDKVFSWDYLKTLGEALWKYFLSAGEASLNFLASVLNAIGETIWQPLKYGWDMMIYGIKQAFFGFLNWFIDKINWVVVQGKKVGLFRDSQELERAGGEMPRPEFGGDEIKNAWSDATKVFTDNLSKQFQALTTLGKDLADPLESVFSEFTSEFKEVLEKPIAGAGIPGGFGAGMGAGGGIDFAYGDGMGSAADALIYAGLGKLKSIEADLRSAFIDSLITPLKSVFEESEIGKISQESTGSGMITAVLESLVGSFAGLIASVSSIQMILNPLQTILSAMMGVLEPVINTVLAPLVGILTILGQTIGQILAPAFQILTPVIKLVGEIFVWLYNNILKPVGNALITIFNLLFNAVAAVANGLISIYNALVLPKNRKGLIEYKDLKAGHLADITYSDVENSGIGAINETTAGAGGGASYTAGRTINQTVNIYTDVIAGEGGFRALALMIRDEIYSAEALGA